MVYQTLEIVPETLYYLSGVFLSDAQMEGNLLKQSVGQKVGRKRIHLTSPVQDGHHAPVSKNQTARNAL